MLRRPAQQNGRRSGQTMIFLIMLLIVLVFVVLWNFDLHKILYVKFLSQNAGDAAAMGACRWQATSLNLIGDLNLMHILALSQQLSGVGGGGSPAAISELQARLCYVGPMVGLMAAQQAAKNNRIQNNDQFTEYLRSHADTIRYAYPRFIVEPYTGCLNEYAIMLESICDNGIAAGPDNMQLYTDYLGSHTLLDRSFYDAIAGRLWCWFYFNHYALLKEYRNYRSWPPLPPISNPTPDNCEFFSLHLHKAGVAVHAPRIDMNRLKQERGLPGGDIDFTVVVRTIATMYCYDHFWPEPFAMADDGWPAAGAVKNEYNYSGADAAIRIEASDLGLRSPGTRIDKVTWTAAAKPFGYLENHVRPTSYAMVLPAFRDVRLIPVDASSAPSGGSFDLNWRQHAEQHLPDYVENGMSALHSSCWFCQQLLTWEQPSFRDQGLAWLAVNSHLCVVHTGGGSSSMGSGGSRRGH